MIEADTEPGLAGPPAAFFLRDTSSFPTKSHRNNIRGAAPYALDSDKADRLWTISGRMLAEAASCVICDMKWPCSHIFESQLRPES
jgi:hypothetical protein